MKSGNPKMYFVIRLGSKGMCFICLRDAAILDQGTDGGGDDIPEVRLHDFTDFLGINTKSILKKYFACELSKCEGLEVKLCGKCSSLMDQFSSLYQTLQVTQLKLNQCLDKIQELIDEADRDNDRVEKVKQKVTHGPTAGVLKEMRKSVQKKCWETLEGVVPLRVVLERVSTPTPDVIPPSAGNQDNLDEEDELGPGSGRQTVTKQTAEQPRKAPVDLSFPKVGTDFCCRYCDYKSFKESNVRCHAISLHCHEYFTEHRLPSVTLEQFQSIVSNPLFQSMLEREGTDWRCQLCSEQLTTQNRRMHLVLNHYENLVEKIMVLQRDPNLVWREPKPSTFSKPGPARKSTTTTSSTKSWSCSNCRVVTENQQLLRRHIVNNHLETYFAPEEFKVVSLTSQQFKQTLYQLLFEEYRTGSKDGRNKCPDLDCHKSFGNYTSWFIDFKIHMIQKHYTFLTQKLRVLQMDPEIHQKLAKITGDKICKCGQYFGKVQFYYAHRDKFCKLAQQTTGSHNNENEEGTLQHPTPESYNAARSHPSRNRKHLPDKPCPHCRAVIPSQAASKMSHNLDHHLLRHHLETYFEPEEEYKEPSLTSYQFKQVLEHLLCEYVDASTKVSGLQKCPHCPRMFRLSVKSGLAVLKLHLLQQHHDQLAKRLKELQKDPPVLLETLGKMKGFECKCGAYFSNSKAYSMHQRIYCYLLDAGTTSSCGEGAVEVDDSTGLRVGDDDDDEGEFSFILPHDDDSASEHGSDPLSFEYENDDGDDEESEPIEWDSKPVQVQEFAFVTKVGQEEHVKDKRKRRGSELDTTAEIESPPPKVSKITDGL